MRLAFAVVGLATAIGVIAHAFHSKPPYDHSICTLMPSPLVPERYAASVRAEWCPWRAYGFRKQFSGILVYEIEGSVLYRDGAKTHIWLRFDSQASRDFPVLERYILDGPAWFRVRLVGRENLLSGHYGYRGAYSGEVLVDRFETVELISGPIDWSKPQPSRHPLADWNP